MGFAEFASSNGPSSVNLHIDAGDEATIVRGEEQAGAGYVLRLTKSLQWDVVNEVCPVQRSIRLARERFETGKQSVCSLYFSSVSIGRVSQSGATQEGADRVYPDVVDTVFSSETLGDLVFVTC